MITHWLLAAIHLSAFGLALAAIATRNRAFKRIAATDSPQVADLRALFRADTGWGLTALVIILLLEIRPMLALIRWRGAVARGGMPDVSRAHGYSRICHAQAALIIVIVFAAAGMARGVFAG
ncbi:DUF2214 family protein [Burkholderia gladioli]|uniref:DUF2214 family protein n=1 Tax=Burkholderia gladioli TaxID=28095 RepID=UPI00163EB9FF|nr:DUF2214 family protein [Burkholderia gladioli]